MYRPDGFARSSRPLRWDSADGELRVVKFEPDRSLFPFDNRFFTTSGGSSLHYVDEGRGQPILLLHGNPTWSFLYRKMILALR